MDIFIKIIIGGVGGYIAYRVGLRVLNFLFKDKLKGKISFRWQYFISEMTQLLIGVAIVITCILIVKFFGLRTAA